MNENAKAEFDPKMAEFRINHRKFLLENPNYFGVQDNENKLIANFQPVLNILNSKIFEELTCVSYKPDIQRLSAIIRIKQPSGYSGGPCSQGSKEYVRFYVSYDNGISWLDEGVIDFDAHDLGFKEELCYEVGKPFISKKKSCCDKKAVLPLVRAILSWNMMPPPGIPGWLPIWGNALQSYIQAPPSTSIFCHLTNVFTKGDIKIPAPQLEFLGNELATIDFPVQAEENFSLKDLRKYYGRNVDEARIGYSFAHNLLSQSEPLALNYFDYFKKYELDLKSILDFLKNQQFNTTYEEVRCVGINRNYDLLNAAIHIKRSTGYMGGLCKKGSKEYLAYYLDFGAGWVYMGTSSVVVHDIDSIPADGLWYNAPLAISLNQYQKKWCETGKARIRVILSWNVVPPVDPHWIAPWGDREECNIEIKPLPKGIPEGQLKPFIELLGGMPVDLISPVTGNATGLHTLGFTANDSPFDGNITIRGRLFNQEPHVYRYRLLITEPATAEHPVMDAVNLKTDTFGVLSPLITLTPVAPDGWISYLADPISNTVIVDDIFGNFVPTKEGIHRIRIEFWDVTTNTFTSSNSVPFNVDKVYPIVDIDITSGGGDCGDFHPGDTLEGTYSFIDVHSMSMGISLTPAAEAVGSVIEIDGVVTSSLSYAGGTLPGGGQSGTWKIHTPATIRPCGYNVWISGTDRTIVHSSGFYHYMQLAKGFCIE